MRRQQTSEESTIKCPECGLEWGEDIKAYRTEVIEECMEEIKKNISNSHISKCQKCKADFKYCICGTLKLLQQLK